MTELLLAASIAVFAATIAAVFRRPFNVKAGYAAAAGAAVMMLLGITTVKDVETVWYLTWNATFTLVAVIISSMIFDEAGFFEYAAIRITRISGGSGMKLFVLLILLSAGISAVFSNDGAILVMTPIVYSVLVRMGIEKKFAIAFIMGTGMIADTASLPLTVSNLTNILTANYFGIHFLAYAAVMAIPEAVSVGSTALLLTLFYRKSIGKNGYRSLNAGSVPIRDHMIYRLALPFISVLIILYSVGSLYGIPVSFFAIPAVAVLAALTFHRKKIDMAGIVKRAPWQIVIFSLGMYIIVFGLGREGITGMVTSALTYFSGFPGPASYLASGFMLAAMSAVMNNLPSVMIGNLAISGVSGHGMLPFVNVIANNIGPKFTTVGSLATLLWLNTLERKGFSEITTLYYMKVGASIALPVLALALLALWAVA